MRIKRKNLDKNEEKEYNYLCQKHGGVAQLGERTVRIRKVESSILFVSTKKKDTTKVVSFFLGSAPHGGAPPFGD